MADIEMTVEEYEKVREEMLMWFSRNGFLIEERGENLVLTSRAQPESNNEYTLDANFAIVSASGEFASKKKRAYMQIQTTKAFESILAVMKS